MQKTVQTEWAALNIKEIACPKCGVIGQLQHFGMDYRKKYHRVYCVACKRTSSELQLMQPVEAVSQPVIKSNNTTSERLGKVEEALVMLTELLKGQGVEVKLQPAEPEPATFNWDGYSEERQMKIQQEIGILREHPGWGSIKLQNALQKINMGLSKTDIIKVKNAFREGCFNA